MGDSTHQLTVQGIGQQDTAQVTVPASVQREMGISIDDEVEVAIHGVSDLIDQASFEGTQTAGDRVTIPAKVVRTLDIVAGQEYEFGFDIPDDESDEAESMASDEADDVASEESSDDSPGLGELFG
jgi:hypothetical protein